MFTKLTIKITLLTSLLLIICCGGLVGCATSKAEDPPAANMRYSQPAKLPADYPTKTLPNGDMWKEFRDDLQLPVDTNNPAVRAQIRWYQNNQGFLNRSIVRGAPYLFYIYQQTKKNHLPAELALIPIGESGYNPVNRSNKGAVGLWQFMPGTAATYGLRMNKYYDGRRDLITSTNAALKYFTYLYYYFDNNWLLAVAAYDTGEGNVQKAILRNQRVNASTNFWALNLHHETRDYIPKLLALSAIIKNPSHYGVRLVAINNAPYFEQVNAGHQISIKQAAKLAGYDETIIRNLNPALLRSVTEPNGPHVLLIPASKVDLFKDRLSNGGSSSEETESSTVQTTETVTIPTTKSSQQNTISQTKWEKHFVAKGETLNSIARDYHTTPGTLRKANKLRSSHLKLRQPLLVPVTINTTPEVSDTSVNTPSPVENDVKPTVEKTTQSESSTSATTSVKSYPNSSSYYTVDNGDTIFSIAKHYNTTPSKIRTLNNLKNNQIKVGQTLKLPATHSVATSTNHNSYSKKTSSNKTNKTTAKTTKPKSKATSKKHSKK